MDATSNKGRGAVTQSTPTVQMLLAGDLFLGGDYAHAVEAQAGDWTTGFRGVAPLFASADLRVGNLEAPLYVSDNPRPKRCLLHSPPEAVSALTFLGFDVLTLGNNHITDHGREGVSATRETLETNGIRCCGAGVDIEEASRPAVVGAGALRMAVISYSAIPNDSFRELAGPDREGYVELSLNRAESDIARAKNVATHVCISLHWGYQYHRYPTPEQVRTAHRLIDLGATVVHGHHPHVLQGIERYGNGVILYSIGNLFMSDFIRTDGAYYRYPRESRRTAVVLCDLSPRGVESVVSVPLMMTRNLRLRPVKGVCWSVETRRLRRLSRPLGRAGYERAFAGHEARIARTLKRRKALAGLRSVINQAATLGVGGALRKVSPRSARGVVRLLLAALGLEKEPR